MSINSDDLRGERCKLYHLDAPGFQKLDPDAVGDEQCWFAVRDNDPRYRSIKD